MTNPPVSGGAVAPKPWRLLRAEDGKVAGVSAGLAAAGAVDVTLVRIAFVVAGLTGFGIIAYLVLAFVVPKQDRSAGEVLFAAPPDTMRWIRIAIAAGAGLGALNLIGGVRFGDRDGFGLGVLILLVGAAILWSRRRDSSNGIVWPWDQKSATPAAASGTNYSTATATPTATPMPTATPSPAAPVRPNGPWAPPNPGQPSTVPPAVEGPRTMLIPAIPTEPARRRRVTGSAVVARVFGWLTVLAVIPTMIAIAGAANADALSIPLPGLFFVLGVVALINLVAWSSSARRAWPVIAAMTTVFTLGAVVAVVSHWNGPIGEFVERPSARSDVPAVYDMAIGHYVIDLRELAVTGDPLAVTVEQGIGRLEVIVPDDATVFVDASVKGGVLALFDEEIDGMTIGSERTFDGSEVRRYDLTIDLGYGRLDVCRASDASTDSHPTCEVDR